MNIQLVLKPVLKAVGGVATSFVGSAIALTVKDRMAKKKSEKSEKEA